MTIAEDVIPKIISVEDFDFVQEKLANNKNNSNAAKSQYLLKGICQCGCCGSKFVGNSKGASDTRKQYCCSGRKQNRDCSNTHIDRTEIESFIIDIILDDLTATKGNTLFDDTIQSMLEVQRKERKLNLQDFRRQMVKLSKDKTLNEMQIIELEKEIEEIKNNPINKNAFKNSALEVLKRNFKSSLLEESNPEAKITFIQAMIKEIVVFEDNIVVTVFNGTNEKTMTVQRNRIKEAA